MGIGEYFIICFSVVDNFFKKQKRPIFSRQSPREHVRLESGLASKVLGVVFWALFQ